MGMIYIKNPQIVAGDHQQTTFNVISFHTEIIKKLKYPPPASRYFRLDHKVEMITNPRNNIIINLIGEIPK